MTISPSTRQALSLYAFKSLQDTQNDDKQPSRETQRAWTVFLFLRNKSVTQLRRCATRVWRHIQFTERPVTKLIPKGRPDKVWMDRGRTMMLRRRVGWGDGQMIVLGFGTLEYAARERHKERSRRRGRRRGYRTAFLDMAARGPPRLRGNWRGNLTSRITLHPNQLSKWKCKLTHTMGAQFNFVLWLQAREEMTLTRGEAPYLCIS